MSTFSLTYVNEDDKAYGLAGMAISLAALDAIDKVVSVNLDSEGPMVNFSQSYYFIGSPAISPKASWDILIRNFHITSAMVFGNVLARSIVRLHENVPDDALKSIFDMMKEEGEETCSLEEDEVKTFFDRTYGYARRIFSNPRVHPAIEELASIISRRRTLSGMEIIDELNHLQLI